MPARPLPTEQEVRSWIREHRNCGRWGKDDQRGVMDLVSPAKRVAAAPLVKTGRSVLLSRPFPKDPGINSARPAQHYMQVIPRVRARSRGTITASSTTAWPRTSTRSVTRGDDEAMWYMLGADSGEHR